MGTRRGAARLRRATVAAAVSTLVLLGVAPPAAGGAMAAAADGTRGPTAAAGGALSAAPTAPPRVVDYLNHVTTRVDSVAEASALFDSLQSLGLVVAWPFTDYGYFASGGLRFGNLNVEIMGADPAVIPMPSYVTFAPVTAVGLEADLDQRRVAHGPLQEQVGADGQVIYARISLPRLESPGFDVQLSAQYTPNRYGPSPIAPRNSAGVVTVRTVNIRVGKGRLPTLRRLLAPIPVAPGMDFGQGPLVTVRTGSGFGMGTIVLTVKDVDRALAAFDRIGLPIQGSTVTVGTLAVRLVPE